MLKPWIQPESNNIHSQIYISAKAQICLFPGGLMYRLCNIQLVLAVCALLSGLLAVLVPLLPNVIMLHIVSFILGSILSTADVGKQTLP